MDDQVPPLEDLSHAFIRTSIRADSKPLHVAKLAQTQQQVASIPKHVNIPLSATESVNLVSATVAAAAESSKSTKHKQFDGFKRGFFLSSTSNTKRNEKQASHAKDIAKVSHIESKPKDVPKKTDDEIPFLCGSASAIESSHDKVTESIKKMFCVNESDEGPEWMNNDFWTRITKSPVLSKAFSDPDFIVAAKDLERNPQEAFQKYANQRPEYITALRELASIIGDHFMKIANEQESTRAKRSGVTELPDTSGLPEHERVLVQRVMTDPEIQAAIKDPIVQRMLLQIRNNPPELRKVLATAKPDSVAKIQKLIECGLLQIQQ